MNPLTICLLFSGALFAVGLVGALARSNAILVLLGVPVYLFWKRSAGAVALDASAD